MDRLNAIKVLQRVVETSSFSVPARELGIGQPAVSKMIARLEDELGVRLVGRTTRRVNATPAGQRVVEELAPLVRAIEEGLTRLARGNRAPAGIVRLAVAPGFGRACILPLLPSLRLEHPGIAIELAVSDRAADLVAENIDLAIRAGTLADTSHLAIRLGTTPVVTVGSLAYLERRGEPSELADLDNHDGIVFFTRGARRAWRFGRPKATSRPPPNIVFSSSSADDIRAAVLADLGLAQVPGWLFAHDLASGTVKAVLRSQQPAPVPLFLVRPAHKRPPDRVRAVEQFLVRAFARAPLLHAEP